MFTKNFSGDTMKSFPTVMVIVAAHNEASLIKECLQSLLSQNYSQENYSIIVVDDASNDATPQIVKSFTNVSLIQNKKNKGFATTNNIALKQCTSDYAILLNADSRVENDFIQQLVTPMESDASIAVCGGAEHPYIRTLKSKRRIEETNWVGLGATIIRMKALKQVHFLDNNYFMYGEDIDLCLRLKFAGWKIYYTPKALWHHYGWGRKVDITNFRVLHSSVSRLYFLFKFASYQQLLHSLKLYLIRKEASPKYTRPLVNDLQQINKRVNKHEKYLLFIKIALYVLPKIFFALCKRFEIRRLPYFNQQWADSLIQETDRQLYH